MKNSPRRRGTTTSLTVLSVGALALTACGGGDDGGGPGAGQAGGEMDEVYDINETSPDELQDGGELTLPVGHVGPQWNTSTNAGNAADTADILEPMDQASAWNLDAEGDFVLNEDYFVSAEQEITDDGTQVLTYELNPDAVWNDGTPIDFDTYAHTADVRSGDNEEYDLVTTDGYDRIESVEMGEDEWHVEVTMESQYQPWQYIFFGGIVHPDVDTPEKFNEDFLNDVQPDYRSGPYILDVLDQSANVVSMVPNDMWWGDTPILERVNFAAHESSSSIPAFQNGEIDAVGVSTQPRYEELTNWQPEGEGYEIRRGQRMATCGFIINTEARNLGDVAVRQAMLQAMDRDQLAAVQFEGIEWEEETPGSWLLLPYDERYEDSYPVDDNDPEGAGETLEEAGWVFENEDDEFRSRDGEELTFEFNTFGDDPINNAMTQAAQSMAAEAGINMQINNQGSGQFGDVVGNKEFGLINLCYNKQSSGADPTAAVNQFYSTGEGNLTGAGDEELDEAISEVQQIEDPDERFAAAQDVEKDALAEYYHYISTSNGPVISAYREGLANYGPRLFETLDWTKVGWEDEAENDGTDTGVDADDLDDDSGQDVSEDESSPAPDTEGEEQEEEADEEEN